MKLSKEEAVEIIQDEITIDAFGDEEISSGWSVFMDDSMTYPFEAEYKVKWKNGKITWKKIVVIGEVWTELNYPQADFCVEIEFDEMIFSVKLDDLRKIKADEETQRAVAVWKHRNIY